MSKCKVERNLRVYNNYKKGMCIAHIAEFERISPQRTYQIICATEFQLKRGNPKYLHPDLDN